MIDYTFITHPGCSLGSFLLSSVLGLRATHWETLWRTIILIVEFLLQKHLISFFNSGGNCLILKRKRCSGGSWNDAAKQVCKNDSGDSLGGVCVVYFITLVGV